LALSSVEVAKTKNRRKRKGIIIMTQVHNVHQRVIRAHPIDCEFSFSKIDNCVCNVNYEGRDKKEGQENEKKTKRRRQTADADIIKKTGQGENVEKSCFQKTK
jgi:hypothetical protein